MRRGMRACHAGCQRAFRVQALGFSVRCCARCRGMSISLRGEGSVEGVQFTRP